MSNVLVACQVAEVPATVASISDVCHSTYIMRDHVEFSGKRGAKYLFCATWHRDTLLSVKFTQIWPAQKRMF